MSCTDCLQYTRGYLPVKYSNLIRHFMVNRPLYCLHRYAKVIHIVGPICLTKRLVYVVSMLVGDAGFPVNLFWQLKAALVRASSPDPQNTSVIIAGCTKSVTYNHTH